MNISPNFKGNFAIGFPDPDETIFLRNEYWDGYRVLDIYNADRLVQYLVIFDPIFYSTNHPEILYSVQWTYICHNN